MKHRFLILALILSLATVASSAEWYKGNLHTHSQWSDGNSFIEWSIQDYVDRGYNFVCPSDHNIFQKDDLNVCELFGCSFKPSDPSAFEGETSAWKPVSSKSGWAKLTDSAVKQMTDRFGADSIRVKKVGDTTFVRMTPFSELKKQFEKPGEFLLIPGYEQTGGASNGVQVHMNFINVTEAFPYIRGANSYDIIKATKEKGEELYTGQNYIFFVNHPTWRYYDVIPEDLIRLDDIRFFELNNAGFTYPVVEQGWTPESFWDAVNAYRVRAGKQILLAMGTDDRHDGASDPKAWMYVRAEELTIPALLDALRRGDSYTSNGIELADVQFNADSKTLFVKVKPEEGHSYRIEFITTKKDFPDTHTVFHAPAAAPKPARDIDVYSDQIGVVRQTVEGTEGSYTLSEDDLYVRARILRDDSKVNVQRQIHEPGAWTQPYKQ